MITMSCNNCDAQVTTSVPEALAWSSTHDASCPGASHDGCDQSGCTTCYDAREDG